MPVKSPVVGIATKHAHSEAKVLTHQLISWLTERQIDYIVDTITAKELQLENIAPKQLADRKELTQRCDPIVILGGDGTLISVCRHPSESSPVIVGVNLGTLGFLTEITADELFSVLQSVLDGLSPVERRCLLKARLLRQGEPVQTFYAINDVVITKEALARIFTVTVYIDGNFAAESHGDGLIVSSPSGSTAYSLAAGGSIVHPQVEAILITPICPHSLTSRPLVVPGSSKITLKPARGTNVKTVYLTIDGQEGMPLAEGDEVDITTSDHCVLFAKSLTKSYYEVLSTKLKWAAR